ncbi:MAG: hypothetical protein RL018_290, partial [Pseudomonadota bacterium]
MGVVLDAKIWKIFHVERFFEAGQLLRQKLMHGHFPCCQVFSLKVRPVSS